jgi:hypothetical protein
MFINIAGDLAMTPAVEAGRSRVGAAGELLLRLYGRARSFSRWRALEAPPNPPLNTMIRVFASGSSAPLTACASFELPVWFMASPGHANRPRP